MKKLTTQKSNYITDRLMELMGTEVGKEYTDELLIAILCIQINELEGKLATERETTKTGSICDHCATVGCIFQSGIERKKCAFYKNKAEEDMGEVSDGYHTFNQLYHQRAVLFATIVNQNKDKAWKSWKHEDGKFCFDKEGEWFIVGVDTPEGSYTYHYEKKYWDMFDCEELDRGKHWDGHTEEDVTRLLSLQPVEPKPLCEDAISRADTIKAMCRECTQEGYDECREDCTEVAVVRGMPPVEPKRPKGEWVENAPEGQGIDPPYICSICGHAESTRTPFCEQCGADMRGDKK